MFPEYKEDEHIDENMNEQTEVETFLLGHNLAEYKVGENEYTPKSFFQVQDELSQLFIPNILKGTHFHILVLMY